LYTKITLLYYHGELITYNSLELLLKFILCETSNFNLGPTSCLHKMYKSHCTFFQRVTWSQDRKGKMAAPMAKVFLLKISGFYPKNAISQRCFLLIGVSVHALVIYSFSCLTSDN
jgi:hypothetical protein